MITIYTRRISAWGPLPVKCYDVKMQTYIHRLRKKRPQYSRRNFDKFRHRFVLFGTNHPDTSSSKTLENLARHCNILTWRWRHIWRHQKCCLQTFNKSFSKGKTWHCKPTVERLSEEKLQSLLIKYLPEKLMNSVLLGSGRRRTWSYHLAPFRRYCMILHYWPHPYSTLILRVFPFHQIWDRPCWGQPEPKPYANQLWFFFRNIPTYVITVRERHGQTDGRTDDILWYNPW